MPACASVFRNISKFSPLQLIKSLSRTKLRTDEKASLPAKYKNTHLAAADPNNGNEHYKGLKGPLSLTVFQVSSSDEESDVLRTENAPGKSGSNL